MSGKNILKTNEITADKVTVDGIVLPKSNYSASLPPSNSNDGLEGYSAGSIWVDITSDKAYICTDNTTSLAQWTLSTQGVTGIAGNTGIQGATGIIGIAGVTGIQGITGIFGETGVQGIRGEAFSVDEFVDIDEAKLTDIEDNSGATADDIYVVVVAEDNRASQALPAPLNRDISRHAITWDGTSWFDFGPFTGVQGEQGTAGIDGVTGVTGVQGTTGILGIDGVTGIQGTTGILGIDGVTGIQGVTGILGIDGVTGIQGVTGILGIDGVTGIQGVTGILGIDGVTGIQGVTGILGIDGVTGIQGVTGILGIDGVTGIQGDTGITGFTGIQGTTGIGTSYEVLLLGEDILNGKACYISVGDTNGDTGRVEGKLYKLDISNEFRMEYCGISAEAKLTDEPANLITSGTASGFTALPKGQPIFASTTTPGDWQADAPTTIGYGIQQLGIGSDVGTELVLNGALSATLVTVQEGVSTDLFVADQIGFIAAFARETDPSGFISAKNKTIGKSTAEYSSDEYKDLYKYIWGLNGVQVETPATKKGFTVLASAKAAGWETDWDAGVNITIDLRDEFLRFSGDIRDAGNHQDHAVEQHNHDLNQHATGSGWFTTGTTGAIFEGGNLGVSGSTNNEGVEETRSDNTTVNPFIRYRNDTKALIHGEVGTVNQFQTETKILSADQQDSGDISDLTFTDLDIGKWYEVSGNVRMETTDTQSAFISFMSGPNATGDLHGQIRFDPAGASSLTMPASFKFQASSNVMYVYFQDSAALGSFVQGDSTIRETFIQLTRRTEYDIKYIAMEEEEVKQIRSVRSSVEKVVGEWIDGSPLYEKSYSMGAIDEAVGVPVDSSINTLIVTPRDNWVRHSSNGSWLKTVGPATTQFISMDSTELTIYAYTGYGGGSNFTIQYTKN